MKKSRERPSWDEFFMFSALWAATRSSCKYIQTGAVIVKDKRIISSGYNGAPPGIKNCLEAGCRKDREKVKYEDKGKGVCRGVHAEVNAMDQISREDLKGAVIYTLYLPCSACAKEIVANELGKVYYIGNYKEPDSLTEELFLEAGVKLEKFDLNLEKCFRVIKNLEYKIHKPKA
jgi:dCMP deaminase